MKRYRIILLLVKAFAFSLCSFEEGMEKGYSAGIYQISSRFKPFYERNNFEAAQAEKDPLIPKIIHQIWLGGAVPEKFYLLMETWKKHHPEWEYKLWTDSDMELFPFTNRKAFDLAKNLGTKADILRYEILYHFGGVYVDVDFECIKPLDPFIFANAFFAGISGYDCLGNAIIGAKPHLPLFKKLCAIINQYEVEKLSNPWSYTGPLFFTRQVYLYLKQGSEKACVYPTLFFHPFPNIYRFEYWKNQIDPDFIKSFFIEETFAVHHWAESWNK